MGPPRSGRKFSFVTDTLPLPTIAGEVQGSDLFICEGMFTEELIESAEEKRHLTAGQAAEIARAGAVKSLGLIHYSPRYTKRELGRLLEEAQRVFPDSFLTTERQTIDIPFTD
jgi:ribonuclease Z